MFVHVFLVHMVEVAVVKIVHVAIVADRGVPAIRPMLMGVVGVVFLGTCGHWCRSLRTLGRPSSSIIPAFKIESPRLMDSTAALNLEDIPGVPGGTAPDYLSHSHGEGFLRFFEERCQKQGIFIFDEPESALSPARQMEFLRLMRRMEKSTICQIVMATHSPILMAYPNARLLRLSKYGLEPVTVEQTDHYKLMREFCDDPAGFVEAAIEE